MIDSVLGIHPQHGKSRYVRTCGIRSVHTTTYTTQYQFIPVCSMSWVLARGPWRWMATLSTSAVTSRGNPLLSSFPVPHLPAWSGMDWTATVDCYHLLCCNSRCLISSITIRTLLQRVDNSESTPMDPRPLPAILAPDPCPACALDLARAQPGPIPPPPPKPPLSMILSALVPSST